DHAATQQQMAATCKYLYDKWSPGKVILVVHVYPLAPMPSLGDDRKVIVGGEYGKYTDPHSQDDDDAYKYYSLRHYYFALLGKGLTGELKPNFAAASRALPPEKRWVGDLFQGLWYNYGGKSFVLKKISIEDNKATTHLGSLSADRKNEVLAV